MDNMGKRSTIVKLHSREKSVTEISRELGMHKQSVFQVISHFQKLGSLNDHQRSRRPRIANTLETRRKVQNTIHQNPKRSIRKMVQNLRISDKRVQHIVKSELGLRPFKLQNAHLLTNSIKVMRVQKCETLLCRF